MTDKKLYKNDLESIVRGACLLSSGGGGTYSSGMHLLENFSQGSYYKHDYVDYIDMDDLPDSDTDCGLVVAYMGAPEKIENLDFPYSGVNAAKKAKAWIEANGKKLSCIVPVEIGALSSTVACTVAAKLDIPVLNGDGAGRAVPELTMTTFAGYDVSTIPTVLANKDDLTIGLDVEAPEGKDINMASIIEELARPIITLPQFDQQAGLAMWVMTAKQMREVVKITGTLMASKNVGDMIWKTQKEKSIVIDDLLGCIEKNLNTKAFELCSGILCSAQNITEGGFDHGQVSIKGEKSIYTVLFQNENLLAWDSASDIPLAMAPDAIAYLVYPDETFYQIVYSNGDLIGPDNSLKNEFVGKRVSLIGVAANSELRECEANKSRARKKLRKQTINDSDKLGNEEISHSFELALEKFGYYGSYVKIEDLHKSQASE